MDGLLGKALSTPTVEDTYDLGLEEHEVTALSRGLYALLRDNPKLVAYLME